MGLKCYVSGIVSGSYTKGCFFNWKKIMDYFQELGRDKIWGGGGVELKGDRIIGR